MVYGPNALQQNTSQKVYNNTGSLIILPSFFLEKSIFFLFSTTSFVRNIFLSDKYFMIYNSMIAEKCADLSGTCSLVSPDFN
jgi:CTP:phosphocholine cytidylyltransferase-like protein